MMRAHRAHAAILPVAIRTKNYKIRPFRKTELIYGAPIPYAEYAPLVENKDYTQAVRRVFDAICALHKEPVK